MPGKQGLDLPQLQPLAPHLDLIVHPAQELQAAVWLRSHQVPGPVQPAAGSAAERVGNETIRRQLRTTEVAPRHARPPGVELAHRPQRHRTGPAVQQVDLYPGDRTTDRRHTHPAALHHPPGDHRRVLRRTVEVDQPETRPGLRPPPQLVPAGEHPAQRQPRRQLRGRGRQHRQQPLQDRRRQEGESDRLLRQPTRQPRRREHHLRLRDADARPRGQHRPQLHQGGVERRTGEVRPAVRCGRREHRGQPGDQVGQAAVMQHRALRPPRRARGIDDVGPIARRQIQSGRLSRAPAQQPRIVQAEHRGSSRELRQPAGQPFHRQEDPDPGIFESEGEAIGRIGRIERHERPARLEHRQQADHARKRTLQAHPHPLLGPHPQPAQPPGEPVGPGVELAVAQPLPALHRRHRSRGAPGLLREPLVDPAAVGRPQTGVVPLPEELLALHRREPRQFGQPALRRLPALRHGGEQPLEATDQALRRRGLEEIDVVDPAAGEPSGGLSDLQHPLVRCRPPLRCQGPQLDPRQPQIDEHIVLQGHGHLEQRRVAEAALRLDLRHQPLERQVLVGVPFEHRLPDLVEQLGEAEVPRHPGPQDQGIGEKSDQPLRLAAAATGDGGADAEVLLPGDPRQERRKGREQGHEQGHPSAAAPLLKLAQEVRRQAHRAHRATMAEHRRPWPVGRQLQPPRHPRQLAPPVLELGFEHLPGPVAALPGSVVGILDRQLGQR